MRSELTMSEKQEPLLTLIKQHETVSINGLIRDKVTNLACHYGIYVSEYMGFRLINPDINFESGESVLKDTLQILQQSGDIEVPENLYRFYQRRLEVDNKHLDVEEVFDDPWNFKIFKAADSEDYYVDILLNQSAAYYNKVVKVPEAIIDQLKAALSANDLTELRRKVDSLKAL
jgi:hypothetical protein